jgi:hypothetical protein
VVEFLETVAAEIEAHVGQAGWDQRPALFALVHAARFAVDEPETAARLDLDARLGEALIPIEQNAVPDGELDEVLARIAWPESVAGCALSQEILMLPPAAEAALDGLSDETALIAAAAGHPDRREARLVVAVLRDGGSAALLRLRGTDDGPLTGANLAPNLIAALAATLHDG